MLKELQWDAPSVWGESCNGGRLNECDEIELKGFHGIHSV